MPVRDLCELHALWARLAHPWWMPAPHTWTWRRPDGKPQGFGPITADAPGLANLLWLSLDLGRPPQEYDASQNGLYTLLVMHSSTAKLFGEPLLDVAGLLPLREFAALLAGAGGSHPVERAYPLLSLLAERRMHRADA